MPLDSLDKVISGMRGPGIYNKVSQTAKGAGTFHSLWKAAGLPSAGLNPPVGAGHIPDSNTVGAIPLSTFTVVQRKLSRVMIAGATQGALMLYDRVAASSGLNSTLITAQTVSTPVLTRSVGGVGLELWLEVYTATGATAANVTVSYTNSSGVAGRSSTSAFPVSPVAGQMVQMLLQSGDAGVQSVQNVTLSASTGTAGDFGITLAKRLCEIPMVLLNAGQVFDYAALGLPVLESGACLAGLVLCSGTGTGQIIGSLSYSEG